MSDYRRFKVKRGVHVSSKCVGGSFKFRSALEEKYAKQLDADDDVLSYSYERVVIPYVVNDKQHMYHVDLIVQRRDVCC